jgi:hypothetical protein
MKLALFIALLSFAGYAAADHIDVLNVELRDDCTLPQYLVIIGDFNKWGEKYNYRTEIAVPLQSNDLVTMFWMGRSPNAASFGKAWDAWRDAQADSSSMPAKLQARISECAEPNSARQSFDIYP